MKEGETSNTYEPTIADVLEAIQVGFAKTDEQHEELKGRLGNVENRLGDVEDSVRHLTQRVGDVEDSVRHLTRRVGDLEGKVDDMHETLEGIGSAVDKDAITIINHEQRIQMLEHVPA